MDEFAVGSEARVSTFPAGANRVDGKLAIMLTAGGARAAYQVGLLKGIARHFPAVNFPIITGVSAGALNAVILAAKPGRLDERVQALVALWERLEHRDVFDLDYLRVMRHGARAILDSLRGQSGSRTRGLVDTRPLTELLTAALACTADEPIEGIRENLRSGLLEAMSIITLDYSTGLTVRWVQGRHVERWTRVNHTSLETEITVRHAMASAAIPIVFPAVQLGGSWHGDGGIRLSAPLSPALHLGATRILVMSTGYHRSPEEAAQPSTEGYPPPVQIVGQLLNAIFLDAIDEDVVRMERMNDMLLKMRPEDRGEFKPIELLVLRPSVDLGKLAGQYEKYLPRRVRFLTRGLGSDETDTSDFVSLLMFEPHYLQHLIEIGERDAESRLDDLGAFFGLDSAEQPVGGLVAEGRL